MANLKLCIVAPLLLAFTCTTQAQQAQQVQRVQFIPLQYEQEVRVGIGAIPLIGSHFDSYFEGFIVYGDSEYQDTYTYGGDKVLTPSVNLSYSYQLKRWLALSATVGYAGAFQNRYNTYDNKINSKRSSHFIAITPGLRFDWMRTRTVKLYSSVGIGMAYTVDSWKQMQDVDSSMSTDFVISLDFTFIGVSVGRRVFGFYEVGAGSHGVIKAGIGFRFND